MSTSRCSQVVFFPFFPAGEQRQRFDKRLNCIFSIAYISPFKQHKRTRLTKHKSLFLHNGRRGLQRQSKETTHAGSGCFKLLAHSIRQASVYQWQQMSFTSMTGGGKKQTKKTNNPPTHFITRQASESKLTMKALSQLVNRLLSSGTESPTSVIDPIVYTTSHVCTCVIQAMFVRVRDIY